MKKILTIGAAVSIALTLAACTDEPAKEKTTPTAEETTTEKVETTPTETTEPVIEPKTEEVVPETVELKNTEAEKELEVEQNGKKITLKGTLEESSNGYNMYVLEGYALEQEEPGRDVLLYGEDGSFFARIQQLEPGISMEEVKKSAMQAASEMGEVFELETKNFVNPYFYDAAFYVMASSEEEGTMTSLVKVVNGIPFKYTVHLPVNDTTVDISTSIWAMLATVAPIEAE